MPYRILQYDNLFLRHAQLARHHIDCRQIQIWQLSTICNTHKNEAHPPDNSIWLGNNQGDQFFSVPAETSLESQSIENIKSKYRKYPYASKKIHVDSIYDVDFSRYYSHMELPYHPNVKSITASPTANLNRRTSNQPQIADDFLRNCILNTDHQKQHVHLAILTEIHNQRVFYVHRSVFMIHELRCVRV